MNTWDQFQKKYNESSKEIREFIDSQIIPDFASKLKIDFQLKRTTIQELILLITDVVLELQTSESAILEIAKKDSVNEAAAKDLSEKIKTFVTNKGAAGLSPLPEGDPTLKERLEFRPEGIQQDAPKPLTREELMSSLSAKRTMADDIEAAKRRQVITEEKAVTPQQATPPAHKSPPQTKAPAETPKKSTPWYKKPLIDEDT